MNLTNLLSSKKEAILKRWFDEILSVYPVQTSNFLKTQKDPFANPIGQTIFHGIEDIFNEILNSEIDSKNISSFLENVIRISAIQDFTASKAMGFIFSLKKAVRDVLNEEINEGRLYPELLILDDKIDNIALFSFDIYMKCREKLHEIKANEVKNMTFNLLRRAKIVTEIEEQ
ncbi:MAG: RsbRD N-terminal domain-containing protein [Nitrospirae bacterium]|nr:RsbRD N-terminal domain-containing protein [Nitrospirota bacterium]